MAELFGCTADNISLHLKNIYQERELDTVATTEDFSVVQKEGNREVTRTVTCYSLEAIIAVQQYEYYRKIQDAEYVSDFDRQVKALLENSGNVKK